MSKKSRSRGQFDRQHGKSAQALFKSASQYHYHIHRSLLNKLSWKKSLLLTCKILGLLVNTLAVDEKYLVFQRDNLTRPIQMQLSQQQKNILNFFSAFLKYIWNFERFEKQVTLVAFVFPKLQNLKTWLEKYLKSAVSEDPSTTNMGNVPNHCWNLHHSTFIIFIGHWQGNCFGNSLFYSHEKSWDCLLTHWLPMKSILFLRETT